MTRAHLSRVRSALLAGAVCSLAVAGCGGGSSPSTTPATQTVNVSIPSSSTGTARSVAPPRPKPPKPRPAGPPKVLPVALGTGTTGSVPAVRWQGQTVASLARTPAGVALLSFNQRLSGLHLHSGSVDAGGSGWRWGPAIVGSERGRVIAAFNGGFRFGAGAGGFVSGGHVAVPLSRGLGSVVTYSDGTTDVGSWRDEVPAPGKTVTSVRQNLSLLIDHGSASANVDCLLCWGATLGGVSAPARSGLGITGDGRLVWAGGESLTAGGLATALLSAGAVRAVELDINPEWVAGYLYRRPGGGAPLTPIPVAPGQHGVPGFFLEPYSRDFFAVVTR